MQLAKLFDSCNQILSAFVINGVKSKDETAAVWEKVSEYLKDKIGKIIEFSLRFREILLRYAKGWEEWDFNNIFWADNIENKLV